MTNRRASRWKLCTADVDMCVCVFAFFIIITMMIIFFRVCLFVSFHHRCCFSSIYSQWESLMELWLDRIGLNWFGIWIWISFSWDSVLVFHQFFVWLFSLFVCSVPYGRMPIHRILLCTHIIFANWSIIKWLINIFAFFSKFFSSVETNRTNQSWINQWLVHFLT